MLYYSYIFDGFMKSSGVVKIKKNMFCYSYNLKCEELDFLSRFFRKSKNQFLIIFKAALGESFLSIRIFFCIHFDKYKLYVDAAFPCACAEKHMHLNRTFSNTHNVEFRTKLG